MRMRKLLGFVTALAMSASVFGALPLAASAQTQAATVKMTYVNADAADTNYGEIAAGSTAIAGYNKISGGQVALANSSWGVNYITYLQVDASAVTGTITKVTLTAEISGSTDSGRESIVEVGYNSSEWSEKLTYNLSDRKITTTGNTFKTTTKSAATFEEGTFDITDALTNDSDKVATILMYATNPGGAYIKNPTVEVEYVPQGAAMYDVTFTETNGVDMTVLYDGRDVTDGTSLPAGTYEYCVRAAGYRTYYGTFTVTNSAVDVKVTLQKMYTAEYTGLDKKSPLGGTVYESVTASNIGKQQNAGETLVYEFDILVPKNTTADITYFGGSAQGTTYRFYDNGEKTTVQYQTSSSGAVNINPSDAYSMYQTGAWAHVKIETEITDTGLGNSGVYVSALPGDSTDPFDGRTLTNKTSSGAREIGPRNLSSRYLDKIQYTGTATIMNECMYTKASNVTINAVNADVTGIAQGLVANNTYSVEVAAKSGYEVEKVLVNGSEVTAGADGNYEIVVSGDTEVTVNTAAVLPVFGAAVRKLEVQTDETDNSIALPVVIEVENNGATGAPESITYTVNGKVYGPWKIGAPIVLENGAQLSVGLVINGLTDAQQEVNISVQVD